LNQAIEALKIPYHVSMSDGDVSSIDWGVGLVFGKPLLELEESLDTGFTYH
jgi:hypothetical protein